MPTSNFRGTIARTTINIEPQLTRFSAAEKESLLHKDPSNMSFTPKAGFIHRDQASKAPIKDQFVWIAKLDSHPGKFEDFLEAIKIHASNVERTEDETLSFLVLRSHDSENSVTLFERYTNEDYFKNTHSTSESMQEYRKKVSRYACSFDACSTVG